MWKSLIIFAAGGFAGLACITAESPTESTPRADLSQQRIGATRLYIENCAKCHGENGEGGGAGTKSLLTKEKFDQKWDRPFFDATKNGVKDAGMEAYGETMSDEQIWALVVHIRELQARALREKFGSLKPANGVYSSELHKFKLETVVDSGRGLVTPWAIDWLPDGKMIVTNRPGPIFIVNGENLIKIANTPASVENGQGGMMEVAVHPDYAKNGWIYLGYSEGARSGRGSLTKIVRGKLRISGREATWIAQETIFEAAEEFYTGAGIHFGTRIAFDGKGHVFFVVGERGGNMLAQSLDNPFGKVYRLNDDGSVPSDNPFPKQDGANRSHVAAIWSLGHRNPQGLVFDAKGDLWVTEHGPRGGDEVNRIVKGANYGWPVVAFSINYSDAPFRTPWPKPGENFKMPAFRWLPSIGACGLDVARGKAFARWSGDLLAGGLSGMNVDRLRLSGDTLIEREELLHGLGRVREVAVGPDGFVYVALNSPDKIIRLVPAD